MGLFDTVHLPEPLRLPGCDEPVTEVQTKVFGNLMEDYVVGSVIQHSPVLIGVVEETIWCRPKLQGTQGTTHPVYFTIWHGILAGVYLDRAEAEARLRTVDRADLIAWLDEAQKKSRAWRGRYRSLFADVREWQERQQDTEEKAENEKSFRRLLRRLPDEIIQTPDPLAAILDLHRKKEDEPEDDAGSFLRD